VVSIQHQLGELLETMAREASDRAFKELDRKLKQQQETLSELKESVGMIQRQLRSFGANITPQPLIRTSAYDIRNFRKKLGITQEVFAQMLHVNTRTIIRWERSIAVPHLRHKKMIQNLKAMDKTTLCQVIQESKAALYE
jgi:DNA-binding transcriptional regulator YiaG